MTHTIDDFWKARLPGLVRPTAAQMLRGWSIENAPNPSFVEADLNLRDGFDDLTAPIWFVAAPGAVGKSTLAKEISARTGAVYLDLAKADTVAGNYLTGGLVKNHLLGDWQENKSAVLIDALDEARLRVTQKSFQDFLKDVETLSAGRSLPTVLFGRVGIIEEAWLILSESGLNAPIFDIDFFNQQQAVKFIVAALHRLAAKTENNALRGSLAAHLGVYEAALTNFVTGLRGTTKTDDTRFAGYAPVLEAVATVLAGVTNPARLNETVQEAMEGEVLRQLTDQILNREAMKLRDQLPPIIPRNVKHRLYDRAEQLARLASIIYQTPAPPSPADLSPEIAGAYDQAVGSFMPNHPFLDGTGRSPSGAVFAAVINANALFSASTETWLPRYLWMWVVSLSTVPNWSCCPETKRLRVSTLQ